MLVLVAVVALDWQQRNLEMDRLLRRIERAEEVMLNSIEEMDALYRRLSQDGYTDDERRRVRAAAASHASEIIVTSDAVSGVFSLPWHLGIRDARRAYVRHAKEWESYYRSGAKDEASLSDETPDIPATFDIAEKRIRSAIPPFPLYDLPDRVDDIFDE